MYNDSLNVTESSRCSHLAIITTNLRDWNTGLVSSGISLTSWGEGAYLTTLLVDHSSCVGVTIKMPYGAHVSLYQQASHPIFS